MQEEENKNGGYEAEGNALVGYIRERFQQAETSKIYDEKRWLKAYRNYRGLYGPEGKQPNRPHNNIDFSQHTHRKQEPFAYDVDVPTKSGSEHVQDSLFKMADEKDY